MYDEKMNDTSELLTMKSLSVSFRVHGNWLKAVEDVDLSIHPGEIVGIVGESGSGKSVMSQSVLRLRDSDGGVKYEGELLFKGEDLLKKSKKDMEKIRGNEISIIFQDPMTSLSPVHTIKKQLTEVLMLHKGLKKAEASEQAVKMLKLTGIADAEGCMRKYPFELSGGMQQRVMIAMALACEPALLIADEPTTALDVTIQEQILYLIRELNERTGMAVMFITHDMGAVAGLCDTVKVVYLGQVVESASKKVLFDRPMHPYTQGLLACIPHLKTEKGKPLPVIEGSVPPLSKKPVGCHFSTRCPYVQDICKEKKPADVEVEPGHFVKCFRYEKKEGVD